MEKLETKKDLLTKLRAYGETPDDDVIRIKKQIEDTLIDCPEILYALNESSLYSELFDTSDKAHWVWNKERGMNIPTDECRLNWEWNESLQKYEHLGEWDRYFGSNANIRPFLFIPDTQTDVKHYICYQVSTEENVRYNSNEKLLDITLPDKYILFIGRLSYVKNLFLLLDAFERGKLDDNYLVIVGDGEMKDALIEKTKKMNKVDKIMFLGEIENPLPILKRSQLLVLPSFSEAYPTILLEALCLYIPVLSTPTKGAKEILNNMAGTYISNDYYNIEEFAKLMENGVKEKLDPQLVDRKISLNFIDVIGFRIQYEIIEN